MFLLVEIIASLFLNKFALPLALPNFSLPAIGCAGIKFCDCGSFVFSLVMLEEKVSSLGGKTVGYTSTAGYDFDESKAVRNDNQFCGLAIDEDNQSDLTEERVMAWVEQLKKEFQL